MDNMAAMIIEVKSLISTIGKLKDSYDKIAEIEGKKVSSISTEGGKKGSVDDIEKRAQLYGMLTILANTLTNMASSVQNSNTWQQIQGGPQETTMGIVEQTARAGRRLSRTEINRIFQREVALGNEIAGAMEDAEIETGLAPEQYYRFKNQAIRNTKYGLEAARDWLQKQWDDWTGGGR